MTYTNFQTYTNTGRLSIYCEMLNYEYITKNKKLTVKI